MAKHNTCQHGIRNHVHKKEQYWGLHISRSVAPGQPIFESEFEKLKAFNSDIIRFKKIGELGLTLVMVDPLLHDIFDMGYHERVPKKKVSTFAAELNSLHEVSQSDCLHVEIADPKNPYSVYGSRYFGLQVKYNEELYQDRQLIVDHILDRYQISKNQAKSRLKNLDPHITLGSIMLKGFDKRQRKELFLNPNSFMDRRMREYQSHSVHVGGEKYPFEIPIFPERICLNGVEVVAERSRY